MGLVAFSCPLSTFPPSVWETLKTKGPYQIKRIKLPYCIGLYQHSTGRKGPDRLVVLIRYYVGKVGFLFRCCVVLPWLVRIHGSKWGCIGHGGYGFRFGIDWLSGQGWWGNPLFIPFTNFPNPLCLHLAIFLTTPSTLFVPYPSSGSCHQITPTPSPRFTLNVISSTGAMCWGA